MDFPLEEQLARLGGRIAEVKQAWARVIVGQEAMMDGLLLALLSGGHCLITGAPGLGKTLLIKTLAQSLSLSFKRIQFTPDLMPADIFGTEVVEEDLSTGRKIFRFVEGPVFTQVLLADEINRTPPKTQAALLEAMEERQVTAGGQTRPLPAPFFVLATQNPIELEGTYPLPEAQLDRFLLNLVMDYLPENEEVEMVLRTTGQRPAGPAPLLHQEDLRQAQTWVREIPVAPEVAAYAVRLVAQSRPGRSTLPWVKNHLKWGAGSRASQALILAGKARVLLQGRLTVTAEDVRALAPWVLRHRLIPSFSAEAEGLTVDALVARLLAEVPA